MTRRAIGVLGVLIFAAGCDHGAGSSGAPGAGSAAPALPTATAAPVTAFNGTYRSTWGDTVFVQTGTSVAATYPGGTMTCTVAGNALDCAWREGGAAGKAHLVKQPGGPIDGTWGNDASDRDGGKWNFVPKG